MEKKVTVAVGEDSFEAIRSSASIYVDKSGYLKEILESGSSALLLTRPRRFGKTTFQTMLSSFLDIRKDSREYFKDLKIYEDSAFIEKWMNRYPVIYISLKEIEGNNYESGYQELRSKIRDLFKSYSYLLKEAELQIWDKETFLNICNKKEDPSDISSSLLFLSRILYEHYNKRVFILIDEYDVPLAKADHRGYYNEMLSEIRKLFSYAFKGNDYLKKAVLTGCLRVSKESLFTGINNFECFSLTDQGYPTLFGFTDEEVSSILKTAEMEDKQAVLKTWYDGYLIAGESIYCPWDVLNYVSQCINTKDTRAKNYWANTSGNDAVKRLIKLSGKASRDDYENLLNGYSIEKKIQSDLTYDTIYKDTENIWSLLFHTGYLTLSREYGEEGTMVRLPNVEIKNIFKSYADEWFQESIEKKSRKELFSSIWNKDEDKLSKYISDTLFDTISYYDYSESYYHGFLTALLSNDQYSVKSNRETGLGRADIILIDGKNNRAAIFELKTSKTFNNIEKDAEKALEQIDEMRYADIFYDVKTILKYGISFYKKSAKVLKGE